MALNVGEVVTFFEGVANNLFKTIDEVEKKLQKLASQEFVVKITGDVGKVGENVSKGLDQVNNKLDEVSSGINNTVTVLENSLGEADKKVRAFTKGVGERATESTTTGIKSAVTKATISTVLAVQFLRDKTVSIVEKGVDSSGTLAFGLLTKFLGALDSVPISVSKIAAAGLNIRSVIPEFLKLAGTIGSITLPVSLIVFALREVGILIKQIAFDVQGNATTAEKTARTIDAIDKGVNNVFLTTRNFFVFLGLSTTAIFVPLSRIFLTFPLVRAFLTFATSLVGRLRRRSLELLGVARNGFSNLIKDGIIIARRFQTGIRGSSKAFAGFIKNANKSTGILKNLKLSGDDFKKFSSLSRLKLPFFAQFQVFATEPRVFAEELILKITEVSQTLKTVFGLSLDQIITVEKQAKKSLDRTTKRVDALGKEFVNLKSSSIELFFKSLKSSLLGIINPIVKIAGILSGVTIIYKIIQAIKGVYESLRKVARAIEEVFVLIGSFVGGLLVKIYNASRETYKAIAKVVRVTEEVVHLIGSFVGVLFAKIYSASKSAFSGITKFAAISLAKIANITGISKLYRSVADGVSRAIIHITVSAAYAIENLITRTKKTVSSLLSSVLGTAKRLVIGLFGLFKGIGSRIGQAIGGLFGNSKQGQSQNTQLIRQQTQLTNVQEKTRDSAKRLSSQQVLLAVNSKTAAVQTLLQEKNLDAFNKTVQRTGTALVRVNQATPALFTGIQKDVELAIKQVFRFEALIKKDGGLFSGKAFGSQNTLSFVINFLGFISQGERKVSELGERLNQLLKVLAKLEASKPQNLFDVKPLAIYNNAIEKSGQNLKKLNFDSVSKGVDGFLGQLEKSSSVLQITAKNAGDLFVKTLTTSLKSGNKKEFEEAVAAFAKFIAAYFPQSPAKKGPLKNLKKSGAEIAKQLANGLPQGGKILEKETAKLASTIAGYFPRSPALFGALKGLVSSGAKIPLQLAQGIRSGRFFVLREIQRLDDLIIGNVNSVYFQAIKDTARQAGDLKLLSDRLGAPVELLSQLDFVAEQTGSSLQEIIPIIKRIEKAISDAYKDPNGDTAKLFKKLGISIESIRNSSNPAISGLLSVQNALKGLPPNSELAKKALEEFGIFMESKAVDFLKLGEDGFRKLAKEGSQAGLVLTSEFAKTSRQFDKAIILFERIKKFILIDILSVAIPKLKKGLDLINRIIIKNRIEIRAFLKVATSLFFELIKFATEAIQLAVTNPLKALEVLKKILIAFFLFIEKNFKSLKNILTGEATNFFKKINGFLFSFIPSLIKGVLVYVLDQVRLRLKKISLEVLLSLTRMLDSIGRFEKKLYAYIAGFFNSVLGSFSTFRVLILQQIPKLGEEVKRVLKAIFEDILSYLERQAKAGLLRVRKVVADIIAGTPALITLLKKVGLGGIVESAEDISKVYKDALEDLERPTSRTGEIIEGIIKNIKDTFQSIKLDSFTYNTDDIRIEIGRLKSEIDDLDKQASKKLKKALNDTIERIKELEKAAAKTSKNTFNPEAVEEFSKSVKKLANDLKSAFKGSGLEDRIEKILELISQLSNIRTSDAFKNASNELQGLLDNNLLDKAKTQEDKEESPERIRKLNESTINAVGGGFETALKTLAEKGTLTMQDLGNVAKEVFNQSFGDAVNKLKEQLTEGLTQALQAVGAGPAVSGLISGLLAGVSLLLSRIGSEAEVVNHSIQETTIETAEKVRGLIAGDTNIAIQEVADRILNANIPVVVRLDRIISKMDTIISLMGGQKVQPQSIGLIELI